MSFALGVTLAVVSLSSVPKFSTDIANKFPHGTRQEKEKGRKQIDTAVIGHVHMAKTGGTTLNGLLALNYETVCGHKGYSFDYFKANQRFNASQNWRIL